MRTLLIFLLLLAAGLCAAFVANGFSLDAVPWQRLKLALIGIVPLLPALVLLRTQRARSIGIAYAAAGGLIGALVLALPAGLMLFISGFSADTVQRIDALIFAGYELALVAIAITAALALFAQARSERAYVSLFVSALLVGGYAGFVSWLAESGRLDLPHEPPASVREHEKM